MMVANPNVGDIMLVASIPTVLLISRCSCSWIEDPGRIFGRRFGDALGGGRASAPTQVHTLTPWPETRA